MKLNRIKAACKAREQAYIINDVPNAVQWISNGVGAYKVEGVWFDETSLKTVFDIPNKKWEWDWLHKTVDAKDMDAERFELLSAVWAAEGEIELEPCGTIITYLGQEIRRFATTDGRAVYAPLADFSPFKDNARYALRIRPGIPGVVAVYQDLLCQGIVSTIAKSVVGEMHHMLQGYIDAEVI